MTEKVNKDNKVRKKGVNKMTKIMLVAVLGSLWLAGCKDGEVDYEQKTPVVDVEKQREIDLYERFERNRAAWRADIATQAKNNPDEVGFASISFWKAKPLDTIYRYEKEFGVKVRSLNLYHGGIMSRALDPTKTTKEGVELVKQDLRKSLHDELESEKRFPGYTPAERQDRIEAAQAHLDLIDKGKLGVTFIGLEGKWKDIERLATAEYNKEMIRVLARNGKNQYGPLYFWYAPEYMTKPEGYEEKE